MYLHLYFTRNIDPSRTVLLGSYLSLTYVQVHVYFPLTNQYFINDKQHIVWALNLFHNWLHREQLINGETNTYINGDVPYRERLINGETNTYINVLVMSLTENS